jgi:hypothetical protein
LITPHVAGTLGSNGWYVSNVTVTWDVSDPDSGIASSSGCGATVFTADTAGTTLTCSATNGVGLMASVPITIKIDKTAPIIEGTRTPGADPNGWNNAPVTVSFHCSDGGAGLASGSPPAPTVLMTEGANQSVSAVCVDVAGNTGSASVQGINIDLTRPTMTIAPSTPTLWPPNGKLTPVAISGRVAGGLSGIDPSNVTFKVSDEYSEIKRTGAIPVAPDGAYSFSVMLKASRLSQDLDGRQYEIVVSALDKAGNQTSASTVVTVPHDQKR